MYCGNEIYISKETDNFIVKDFDFDHFSELMEKAYASNNYTEAYKYATTVIEKTENKSLLAPAWVYKGWSAGMLSTVNRPRIEEMISYIKTAIELNKSALNLEVVISNMVWILYSFNYDLFSSWVDFIIAKVENRPQSMVLTPQKSISESIGAGLGAGLAQGMVNNSEAKRQAKQFGAKYQSEYLSVFSEAIKYSWSIDKSKKVAENIILYITDVIKAPCIDAETKRITVSNLDDVLKELLATYSQLTLPEIKGDGCGCSPCFIATAVMDDPDHPFVNLLRQFRDEILEKSLFGQAFITVYYKVSPPIAGVIRQNITLRLAIFKVLIFPLTKIANNAIKNNRRKHLNWVRS